MKWLLSASFLASLPVLNTAWTAQIGSAEGGYRVAREMCAECHLLGEEAGRSTNADAPTFKDIANTPGMTGAALRASLQNWHENMPSIIVKGEDADNLIAYILSLKKADSSVRPSNGK